MKTNQRVNSPLGKGTVIGPEVFTDSDDIGVTPRWEVELDDPTKWAAHILGFNPFIPERDLCDINHDLATPIFPTVINHGKVFNSKNWYVFHCPNCDRQVSGRVEKCTCGQALEWAE